MKSRIGPWMSFQHDLRLMIFEPRGILDEAQVLKAVETLEELEAATDEPFNRFTNLSRIDMIDVRYEFIFGISLHRRRAFTGQPTVKSAFYATSEASLRLARIHLMLTDHSPLRVKLFEEMEGAAEWLGVSPDALLLGDEESGEGWNKDVE